MFKSPFKENTLYGWRKVLKSARLLLICSIFFLPMGAAAQPLEVATTIKPVHSLSTALMQGVGISSLIIKTNVSPHSFSLTPSQVRQLHRAQIVIRISPDFETVLQKQLSSPRAGRQIISLINAPAIVTLPQRTINAAKSSHGLTDSHIWLNPQNAIAITRTIAGALKRAAPKASQKIDLNAQRLITRLTRLDAELATRLAPWRKTPYAVFHDAYQYFENHYHLNRVIAVMVNPARSPGARRLKEVRKNLIRHKVKCIFSEPQHPARLINTIRQNNNVRIGTLDPLGADIPAGPDHYFDMMRKLAKDLITCLRD